MKAERKFTVQDIAAIGADLVVVVKNQGALAVRATDDPTKFDQPGYEVEFKYGHKPYRHISGISFKFDPPEDTP